MSINAGTIAAYLTLDTNKFTSAMSSARSQLKTLKDEGANFSDKMTAVGGAFTTVGTSMTKNWTVPLLSAGISAGTFAVKFEDAFAGVRKTVDATEEEYEQLSDSIMRMAAEMPTAAEEIAGVMEAAGQLGIQKENLESFTEVMVQLGDTTNLSANSAATTLARFANITGMSQENFDRLGSTIVDLGNNFATTEAEISDMALRIAGAGKQVGMTEADIMGVAAALSSVGLEAEAGGTAISKVLTDMSLAVEKGVSSSNKDLQNFAKVAGMSSEEFSAAFKEDAAGALSAFVSGLGSLEENGISAIAMLDEMGITEVRMRDALLRSSGAADTFTAALETASTAWNENTALTTEAEKRYATTASQLKILWNQIKAVGVQFGEILIPYLKKGVDVVGKLVGWFSDLDDGTKKFIVTAALIAASIGPIVTGIGRLISFIGTAKTAITTFNAVCMANPYVLLATAIIGVSAAIGGLIYKAATAQLNMDGLKSKMESIMTIASNYEQRISSATGAMEGVNENLYTFDSTSKIETEISQVQNKITKISKLASEERRSFTQNEIKLLEDYYEQLNSLTEREYEIYSDKMTALEVMIEEDSKITTSEAESYLKELQTIREQSVDLAKEAYAEQVASLTSNYDSLEDFYTRASTAELETLREAEELRDKRINTAEQQYARLTNRINEKYIARNVGSTNIFGETSKYKDQVYEIGNEISNAVAECKEQNKLDFLDWGFDIMGNFLETEKVQPVLDDFVESFDIASQEFVATVLYMAASTEAAGGEVSDSVKLTMDEILSVFELLPTDAKESMKDTWLGMKEELEAGAPELFAAAEADADSIINAIDEALGIASPSRVMRERGQYAIQGIEKGMSDEKSNMISSFGGIMDEIKEKAEKLNLESAGANVMDGLQRGMSKKKPSLLATAGSIANSISAKIRSALDIHSPSRVMAAIGSQVSAGLAIGMEDYSYEVRDAAENLATITSTTVRSSAQQQNIVSGAVSVPSKTNNTENKLDRVISLLEQLLMKDGDIIMDGRVFGRWARENLS